MPDVQVVALKFAVILIQPITNELRVCYVDLRVHSLLNVDIILQKLISAVVDVESTGVNHKRAEAEHPIEDYSVAQSGVVAESVVKEHQLLNFEVVG